MNLSVAEFARLASAASKERVGFEATQVTEGNGLRIEAAVRRHGSRSIHIEYKAYQSSWSELEETLSGQVEFVGDELCGFVLHCEGQVTWIYDPSTDTAIRKDGSQLFEPIPGLATLGELAFLDTLTQDFLLRDMGEERIDERVVRRIALKPKQDYRSQLLSAMTFPIRKATIDFDTETLFPLSISLVPSSGSPAASIVGTDSTIRIMYKDVRLMESPDAMNPFAPPADAHIFEESRVSVQDLADSVPFSMPLLSLSDHGFETGKWPALLTIDAESERAHATVHLSAANDSSEDDSPSPRLTLCVGNYVSRNMARRRTSFSEIGKSHSKELLPVKVLDRSELWEQRLPGIDTQHAPVEAFFEKDGVFWFLSATNTGLDSMEALAGDLFEARDEKAP